MPKPALEQLLEGIANGYNEYHRQSVTDIPSLIEATEPLLQALLVFRMPEPEPEPIPEPIPAAKPQFPKAPSGRPPHIIDPFTPLDVNAPDVVIMRMTIGGTASTGRDERKGGGDCGVIAYAMIQQESYKVARQVAFRHGWHSKGGTPRGMVERMLQKKGWELEQRPDLAYGRVGRLQGYPMPGVFLVYCKEHVMAMVNGVIYNVGGTDVQPIQDVVELRPLVEVLPNEDGVIK